MLNVRTVGLVGFGTMGCGIAQVCAAAGHEVIALDVDEDRLAVGRSRLEAFLEGGVRRGKVTSQQAAAISGRITTTVDVGSLSRADLVIEAALETLPAKIEILTKVAGVVDSGTILATNTSALAITEIAAALPNPERVAGLHFFNPAPIMSLVEVVRAVQTSNSTAAALMSFAEEIGKQPVEVDDRPGFLVNLLLMPYLNDVVQAYDDGLASSEDMDKALELGLGYPMGPLKLLDLIGLDVHEHATESAYEGTHNPVFAPPPLLRRMVQAGRLGRKTGRGFHDYSPDGK